MGKKEFSINEVFNEEEKFKKDSNNALKKRGSMLRVLNLNHLLILAIIMGVFVLSFIYFGSSGKFSPILVDNSTCVMPDIPACPSCPTQTCNCPAPIINLSVTTPTINVRCNSS